MGATTAPIRPLPATLAEIKAGDVVFCARPSLLQKWGEAVGGEWRHVGLIVDTDQGLMMSGFGRSQKYCLIPVERLAHYSRVGIATVFDTPEEVRDLHRWLRQYESGQAEYSVAAVVLGGMYSATRSWPDGLRRRLALAATRKFCERQARRFRDGQAFVCSTFVLAALNAVGPDPVHIPMSWSRRRQASSTNFTASVTDLLLAQWIASPTDVWSAIPEHRRTDLDLSGELEAESVAEPTPSPRKVVTMTLQCATWAISHAGLGNRTS